MDLHQLFRIKEELLNHLDKEVAKMQFRDEIARSEYYEAFMEAIMTFYAKAMIQILDEDTESPTKKSA